MPDQNSHYHYMNQPLGVRYPQAAQSLQEFLGQAHRTLVVQPYQELTKTPEQHFAELDVQPGDRIRLTEAGPANHAYPNGKRKPVLDAAVLEGRVAGVKVKDGGSQVRIDGFGHTGGNAGGQHVWFPVNQYVVEVLHKAYRFTPEDRVVAAVLGYDERHWRFLTDAERDRLRQRSVGRVAKVRAALGIEE